MCQLIQYVGLDFVIYSVVMFSLCIIQSRCWTMDTVSTWLVNSIINLRPRLILFYIFFLL